MKKQSISLLGALVLMQIMVLSCNKHAGFVTHRLVDLNDASIYYIHSNDTLVKQTFNGEANVPELTDSLAIMVNYKGKDYLFKDIPAEYANHHCSVEFSTNEYKDYFPAEWAILKSAGNYASLRLYIENGFFHIIVINSVNGNEIARHAEKF